MANCTNLNKLENNFKKFYKGFGFLGKSNNNLVEMGKYNKGKLNKGIRFYGLLNLLEMGDFRENNTLISGLKRINDDIYISLNFSNSIKKDDITGRCVHIDKDGNWIYGDLKHGKPTGKAVCYKAETDEVFYREYRNKKVVKEYKLFLSNYNINLKVNVVKDKGLYYDLDKADFITTHYDENTESYSMGFPVESSNDFREHGLGFVDWIDYKQQYIGEWDDKNKAGLGASFLDFKEIYGVYNNNNKTENCVDVFSGKEVSYGMENTSIPRFTLFDSGDFFVRNSGDYVLYVKKDFSITIDKYNQRDWVATIKKLI